MNSFLRVLTTIFLLLLVPFCAAFYQNNRDIYNIAGSGLTFSVPTLTVSGVGLGNGSIALSGNTSGTCNLADTATSTSLNSSCQLSWSTGLGAITHILGPSDQTFSIQSGVGQVMRIRTAATGGMDINGTSHVGLGSAIITWNSNSDGSGQDSGLSRDSAGVIDVGNGTQGNKSGTLNAANFNAGTGISAPNLLISTTVPTIAGAGCGGSAASIVSTPNGTAAFDINVGTAPTTACTITMPAAPRVWNCYATDVTTNSTTQLLVKQTGTRNTTSVTLTNFSDVAAASNFTANDILAVSCFAQ